MKRECIALQAVAIGVLLTGCGAGATPTPAEVATSTPSLTACTTDSIDGQYRRALSAEDTSKSEMYGSWTLEIADCRFTISQDGRRQGGGRIELVDGTAKSGRVAVSEDVCPNEFIGEGFYDIALSGDQLQIAEAIKATDQCVGRADAFESPPIWERQP